MSKTFVAVVDGLKGFPEAITAVFSNGSSALFICSATASICLLERPGKPVAAALKGIYKAVDADAGEAALSTFEESFWGRKYPAIGRSWRQPGGVIPFYAFAFCTPRCHARALNSKLTRPGRFSGDEAAETKTPLPGLEPLRREDDHAATQ